MFVERPHTAWTLRDPTGGSRMFVLLEELLLVFFLLIQIHSLTIHVFSLCRRRLRRREGFEPERCDGESDEENIARENYARYKEEDL